MDTFRWRVQKKQQQKKQQKKPQKKQQKQHKKKGEAKYEEEDRDVAQELRDLKAHVWKAMDDRCATVEAGRELSRTDAPSAMPTTVP